MLYAICEPSPKANLSKQPARAPRWWNQDCRQTILTASLGAHTTKSDSVPNAANLIAAKLAEEVMSSSTVTRTCQMATVMGVGDVAGGITPPWSVQRAVLGLTSRICSKFDITDHYPSLRSHSTTGSFRSFGTLTNIDTRLQGFQERSSGKLGTSWNRKVEDSMPCLNTKILNGLDVKCARSNG